MESREAVFFVNFVNLVRTCISYQISLVEREISHQVHKVHKVADQHIPFSQ
jgi:hypothetical protein